MAEPSTKRRKLKPSDQGKSHSSPTITDPRFASIQSDPRYQLPSKRHTHVKLDKRFSRILKDKDFSRKSKVDRYGRPLETDAEQQRLKRRYEFEEDDVDNDEEVQEELRAVEKTRDLLREGRAETSSSEDGSSDEDSDLEEEVEDAIEGPQDADIPMGDVTSRIAVVNLDWDNIRATDLMAVFSSFLPATGRLLKVAIYPSEFGKERMEREEMEGPPKEIFTTSKDAGKTSDSESTDEDEDDEENIKSAILKPDDGSEFDSAALRRYQLERLRYFYAVLTFSSPTAAKAIYDACDGTEYLSTANFFDLRFVPDDTDFSTDKVREECEKIPQGYKPNDFVTDALQHSKVKLTWDAEDTGRKEAQARAFRGGIGRKEIDENDLKAYLGSDSEEEDVEDELEGNEPGTAMETADQSTSKKEKERQKMRALLGLAAEPVKKSKKDNGPVGDLQITFSSGLSGSKAAGKSVFENEPEIEETTVEKYVRKERERKQKRKEKMKSGRNGDAGGADEYQGLHPGAAEEETEAQDLGFDDPFFTEPSNDTKKTSKLRKEERRKKREEREREEAASKAQRAELELLMVDDKEGDVRHFDMAEVERAEKMRRKKGKKKNHKKDEADETVGMANSDGFKMDTQDPRFARLYENHEFAIDPTNPRFKGTEGMRALLDEGRRRKGKADNDGAVQKRESADQKIDGGSDIRQLVEKMKRKEQSKQ
jgi:NUC153 domain